MKAIQLIDELVQKMGGGHPLDKTVFVGKGFSKADVIKTLAEIREVIENENKRSE